MIKAFAMLISGGGIVVISRDLGSKNHEHAKMVASLCTWSAVIFGIVLGVVIILFDGPITSFLGATADIEAYARTYMVILAMGAPFLLITNMLGQMMQAEVAVQEGLIGNPISVIYLQIVLQGKEPGGREMQRFL